MEWLTVCAGFLQRSTLRHDGAQSTSGGVGRAYDPLPCCQALQVFRHSPLASARTANCRDAVQHGSAADSFAANSVYHLLQHQTGTQQSTCTDAFYPSQRTAELPHLGRRCSSCLRRETRLELRRDPRPRRSPSRGPSSACPQRSASHRMSRPAPSPCQLPQQRRTAQAVPHLLAAARQLSQLPASSMPLQQRTAQRR